MSSSLKTLLPVDRRAWRRAQPLTVQVEGQEVAAKVQAILPLPERSSGCASWPRRSPPPGSSSPIPRESSSRDCGCSPTTIPTTPIATIPKRAVKQEDARGGEAVMVQVIRNEYVTNVPVRVLGDTGPERVQIAGALRAVRFADRVVVGSAPGGTLVRFGEGAANRAVEGTSPNPALGGAEAGLTSPPAHAAGRLRTEPRTRLSRGPSPAAATSRSNNVFRSRF